ncbi:hypothetical protein [Micromonospora sicca]|uniref:hypothetical protein n=1 Tax=Micromonospora sicca TaxID=2202420 RepID=UPI0011B52CA8|nr:hypothetical protein [Micromonospora sp. 4G51]
MISEFKRGALSRITIWAGQDGPVPLDEGTVGVEYRGRIGHPSSYGLVAGRFSPDNAEVLVDPGLNAELAASISVSGDRVIDGMSEPEYEAIIRKSARELGLCVVVVLAGEIGSSQVVFSRLARVLHMALISPDLMRNDDQVWKSWEGVQ